MAPQCCSLATCPSSPMASALPGSSKASNQNRSTPQSSMPQTADFQYAPSLDVPAVAAPASVPPSPGQPVSVASVSACATNKGENVHTTIHKVNSIETTCDALDVAKSLSHVVKVGLRSVAEWLILPVREAIGHAGLCQRCSLQKSAIPYTNLMPLVMTPSIEPFAQLFQLSAVPRSILGNVDAMSLIQPVKSSAE